MFSFFGSSLNKILFVQKCDESVADGSAEIFEDEDPFPPRFSEKIGENFTKIRNDDEMVTKIFWFGSKYFNFEAVDCGTVAEILSPDLTNLSVVAEVRVVEVVKSREEDQFRIASLPSRLRLDEKIRISRKALHSPKVRYYKYKEGD